MRDGEGAEGVQFGRQEGRRFNDENFDDEDFLGSRERPDGPG